MNMFNTYFMHCDYTKYHSDAKGIGSTVPSIGIIGFLNLLIL